VGDDDVQLPVAVAGETNIGDHQPAVGQAIAGCPDDKTLLVIGEQRHWKDPRDEQPHGYEPP
jgi:hypothetical protein